MAAEESINRIKQLIQGANAFAAEMREKGIHVGLGSPPVCAVDDEPWPCAHERSVG